MKVRYKDTHEECWSSGFNVCAISEILVGDDSPFIADMDVWLPSKECWKDLRQAFSDHDVITDNYNTTFFEPPTEADRERGFTL